VLTHFPQRYDSGDAQRLAGEAAMAFGGQVVLAHDMTGSPFRPGSRQRPAKTHV
jgi:ribonuclease BN (tRNA processing enzyme)